MKTAVRLGPIAPITGCPVWYDGVTYNQACEEEQVLFTYLATLSHP